VVDSSWNVMAHGDAREGKWRGNWRMEWVASTLHTTLQHGVSNITTADAHASASSSLVNWRSRQFKWTRPFRRRTKYDFCACAITFKKQSTHSLSNHCETGGTPAAAALFAFTSKYHRYIYKAILVYTDTLPPWRWLLHVPPKHWHLSKEVITVVTPNDHNARKKELTFDLQERHLCEVTV
jgi:hypothetical protein